MPAAICEITWGLLDGALGAWCSDGDNSCAVGARQQSTSRFHAALTSGNAEMGVYWRRLADPEQGKTRF